jgi:hypothetical protein
MLELDPTHLLATSWWSLVREGLCALIVGTGDGFFGGPHLSSATTTQLSVPRQTRKQTRSPNSTFGRIQKTCKHTMQTGTGCISASTVLVAWHTICEVALLFEHWTQSQHLSCTGLGKH